ncbi:ABC transporter ATP-binding protein [Halopseudomonas maritima]|uniref:ABC transporter ATP-binding protein n=1 Tax=Halopseudomonas maritima TaxID=2918528 RepID=UPI001EEB8F12|nr:ABC transporter ATP-binding protein [Halopseudomonas maritima]UJJ32209.1 ABC transporter ATP-binding protein [Halopseudomonas maritima]
MSLLQVQDLTFSYRPKAQHAPTVQDVSFALQPGSLVGVVGPNGCGKSTLLKLLAGQHTAASGEIVLAGQPLASFSTRELARQLAYLPQRPLVPAGISVEQLVQYGRHPHQGWLRQWSIEDRRLVEEAIATLQLQELRQRSVSDLSGGQVQRVWLAMIMAQNTGMVLLDEPTSALDIGHQTEVMEAIHAMSANGRTVLIVMHDLACAARYCDQLIAMAEGRVQAFGEAREVISKELIERLYNTPVDILAAPGDGAPVIVPRRLTTASAPFIHPKELPHV